MKRMNGITQRIRQAALTTGLAFTALSSLGAATQAYAQVAAPQHSAPPIVESPRAASGASGASNPDHMPIKRPGKPTHDNMTHTPPASGANAK